jgi:hypothetical protein
MAAPKYPHVHLRLVGEDGNAWAILGRVSAALKSAGIAKDERDVFLAEATRGNYDHLLRTVVQWVNAS